MDAPKDPPKTRQAVLAYDDCMALNLLATRNDTTIAKQFHVIMETALPHLPESDRRLLSAVFA